MTVFEKAKADAQALLKEEQSARVAYAKAEKRLRKAVDERQAVTERVYREFVQGELAKDDAADVDWNTLLSYADHQRGLLINYLHEKYQPFSLGAFISKFYGVELAPYAFELTSMEHRKTRKTWASLQVCSCPGLREALQFVLDHPEPFTMPSGYGGDYEGYLYCGIMDYDLSESGVVGVYMKPDGTDFRFVKTSYGRERELGRASTFDEAITYIEKNHPRDLDHDSADTDLD